MKIDLQLKQVFMERLAGSMRRVRYRVNDGSYPVEKASAYRFLLERGQWDAESLAAVYDGIQNGGCRYPLFVRNYVCALYKHVYLFTVRKIAYGNRA